jgi:hypothetical protein
MLKFLIKMFNNDKKNSFNKTPDPKKAGLGLKL